MSRRFTGTEYISVANPIRVITPISIAAWFNPDNVVDRMTICGTGRSTTPAMSFWLESRGATSAESLRFSTWNDAAAPFADGGSVTANAWHHAFGVSAAPNSREVYLDGIFAGTDSTNCADPVDADLFTIGCRDPNGGPGLFTKGMIAEVAVWGETLTPDEIVSLAQGFSPALIRPQSLLFYAPLVRNLIDIRGGLTLTDNGPSAVADHPRIYY